MNRPELYFKSATILINAYQNETLFHGSCNTCVIANIIAANNGFSIWPFRESYTIHFRHLEKWK